MKTYTNTSRSERIGVISANRRQRRTVLATTAHVCWLIVAVLASYADEATNRVSTIRVPGAGKVVKAQRGADGTIHLLFDSADGPQYVKSQDGGLTFSDPIAI